MFSAFKLKVLFVSNLLITVLLVIYTFFQFISSQEIIYIDSKKVFEGFKMTHDVKVMGDNTLDKHRRVIDSLYSELNNSTNNMAKDVLMQKIVYERDKLEEFNQIFSTEETTKIWNRIHSYADIFAKEHDYRFIIGAQPDYNVLFGSEEADKTTEFLSFINNRYEGIE